MVPEGVNVVAALHTVSAPTLADTAAELDEDVLLCGDRKADKAQGRAADRGDPGAAGGERGPAGDGADRRAADPDADLDQRPLQDPRRDPDRRPARRRSLGVSSPLAGGTGGASSPPGFRTCVGERARGDRQHRRRRRGPRPARLPRPRPRHLLAQRRRSTRSAAGASATTRFTVHERLEQLGAPGWFSLSDRDLATCLYRTHFIAEGGTLTAAQAQIARALGARASVLPMSRGAGADPGATAGRLARAAGVPDPSTTARRRSRGSSSRGSTTPARRPEVLGALADAEAVIDRALEPGDLDRPDPRGARDARGDRRGPAARWSRSARWSAGARSRARPTPSSPRSVAR